MIYRFLKILSLRGTICFCFPYASLLFQGDPFVGYFNQFPLQCFFCDASLSTACQYSFYTGVLTSTADLTPVSTPQGNNSPGAAAIHPDSLESSRLRLAQSSMVIPVSPSKMTRIFLGPLLDVTTTSTIKWAGSDNFSSAIFLISSAISI